MKDTIDVARPEAPASGQQSGRQSDLSALGAVTGAPTSPTPSAPASARRPVNWPLRLALGVAVLGGGAIALDRVTGGALGLGGFLPLWSATEDARAMPKMAAAAQDKAGHVGKQAATTFRPTDAQWQTLTSEPVQSFNFRETLTTDGKVGIDEDHTTPVFSPYQGRVVKLLVKPGDQITVGTPLFTIDAVDMVQAQNDYLTAIATVNKAKSAAQLADRVYARNKVLYDSKAAALKDLQAAEDALTAARNDLKTAEATLLATRNRLTILGKTEAEITELDTQRRITSETVVNSPLAGTVVSRKVGPGQFLAQGASDPAFVIGDLSTVWLIANVRETDADKVRVGQTVEFTTLSLGSQRFASKLTYVAASVDPTSRRLLVRAEIPNAQGLLKPEMFANVTIVINGEEQAVSVPRTALIYEGEDVRVWVDRGEKQIELRKIKVGLTNDDRVQVVSGLSAGDRIITRGSLFIDRLAKSGG